MMDLGDTRIPDEDPNALLNKTYQIGKRHDFYKKWSLYLGWCFLAVVLYSAYESIFSGTARGPVLCVIVCIVLVFFFWAKMHYRRLELNCFLTLFRMQREFWDRFEKERDAAFLSLDKEKILAHLRKYNISSLMNEQPWLFLDKDRAIDCLGKYAVPVGIKSETEFWDAIHKIVLEIETAKLPLRETDK